MVCQLYTNENKNVQTNKEAIKYICFVPVQHRTIIARPIPAPNNANHGNALLLKKRNSAKSATTNNAKRTWFNILSSSKLY